MLKICVFAKRFEWRSICFAFSAEFLVKLKFFSKKNSAFSWSMFHYVYILTWAKMLMTPCSSHVTFAFQSESTLYSCLNVKELFAQSRRKIWSLSYCSWTRTHNHLVHKRTLKHLAKLAKWLSCVVSTYQFGAFACMLLSCHVRF